MISTTGINQLYFYATGSSSFSGDLNKGIHLWGDYGVGKSTILQAFSEIISENSGKNIMMNRIKVICIADS